MNFCFHYKPKADPIEAAGFHTALHFVFVDDLEISMARVRTRVKMGGHDVKEIDQRRRNSRSFDNAVRAVSLVNEAYFYDNTSGNGHFCLAIFKNSKIVSINEAAPGWIQRI